MRQSKIALVALLLLTLDATAGAQQQELSQAQVRKIVDKMQTAPTPFDEPDAAERYYAEQRFSEGVSVDPVALYSAALDHMKGLPRHSARLGAYLPKRADGTATQRELGTWEFLGPGNVGGRTRALVVHPTQLQTYWAAGVSGGIWKTNTGGRNWRPLADLLPNIAVSSLAMDPSDPDVIYAGTGEGQFREEVRETSLPLRGAGIFKTEDGGASWQRLDATRGGDFAWVNKIVVSHRDPRRLYAATRTGVWRSLDRGDSWSRVLASDVKGGCLDVAIRTDRPNDVVFAACGTFEQATVYRNPQANVADSEWAPVLTEEGMGRTSLAIAPSDPNVIYALSASYLGGPGGNYQGGLHAVFRSDLAGTAGSWEAVVRNTDPVLLNTLLLTNPIGATLAACGSGSNNFYSTLGWYANVIAVDPTDPDVVFAGGIDLFRSDDGGRNWGVISYWFDSPPSAHADQHVIAFDPRYDGAANQTMLVGGDGGVFVTDNARAEKAMGERATCNSRGSAVAWTPLRRNYGVTQFYHGAAFPDARSYFGGTQDNGTVLGTDDGGVNGWTRVLGGDGGYVAIDPRNPNIFYAESQHLSLVKHVNGRLRGATNGITDPDDGPGVDNNGDFLFIVPFILDPTSPNRLYLGGRRLWTTRNGAASWRPASTRWSSGGRLSALAVSPADPNRMVVGLNDGTIHYTDQVLAADSDTEWASVRPRDGFVSWAAFDPFDASRVYATYATFGGQHVWSSDDGGATWRPIDGDGPRRLPNVPVHTIVADPDHPERLFVGTDLGVFVSTTGGSSWAVERTGFANALTEALQVVTVPEGASYLFAFTHGRGAWRAELADP